MTTLHVNRADGATYTPAVSAGGLVFTSGQVGEQPHTGDVPADFAAEVHVAFDNLEQLLADASTDLRHLVKMTCYLADIELADTFNRIYLERVPEPRPARATVQVRMIAPYRVELDCVATTH